MQEKPNRVQTAVELSYDLTKNNITGTNLDGHSPNFCFTRAHVCRNVGAFWDGDAEFGIDTQLQHDAGPKK